MPEKKRLKILFLPTFYPSEKNPVLGIFIKEHAKAVSLYNEVLVLYSDICNENLKKTWQVISDKQEDEIRTIRIKYKKPLIHKIHYFFYIFSVIQAFKTLLIAGRKPDIIHAHFYPAGVPAVILGKKYKIPVVISEHWSAFPRHTLKIINILKARFAMNRANVILPVSKNLGMAIQSYGIKNRYEVIPNVVDTKIFYPLSPAKGNSKKNILFVGLLNSIKGIPFLLKALAQVREKRQDLFLDIVGEGPYRQEYEKLSSGLGLNPMLQFHGLKNKEEIARFMRNANFFILPSLWENLPCVLIEAMASGLPIIASKVGGIPEIVNKDIGILVSPKDTDKLAEAINYMLDHYQDYSPQKISQYAKDNFSDEVVGKKLDKIYRKFVN